MDENRKKPDKDGEAKRLASENIMKMVFMVAASASVVSVLLICIFLFINGFPAMYEIGIKDFLTGTLWAPGDVPASYGILPMIAGSLAVTTGAILLGVPVGLLTAVFMSHYCPRKFYGFLKPALELLAGIPSVVYGFFGLMVLVPFIRNIFGGNGYSILTASLLLGIMILPTIAGVSEAALKAVPEQYYEGALALGATHERAVFTSVLPAARSGILASVVLGTGRAVGETMAVIMIAGNQARMPVSILKGVRTMTANIVLEMGYAADLHRGALIATGVVLFIFILAINIIFNMLGRKAAE
ncbi:MAG: phosphate ABC transporter permease subunit PstC [Eubacteriales bacterium]|nr:phosphate ABC transporter permease subunit PstC [Eubacteriales bacterium]